MDILSIISTVNALIIAFLLSKKKQKSTSDKLLIAWVLNFALHFAMPFFIERNLFFHEIYWGFAFGVVIVTHMPLLYIYTQSLVDREFSIKMANLWHFGFVLFYILTLIPSFIIGKEKYIELVYGKHEISFPVFLPMIAFLFCQIYFLIRTIILLLKHQYKIKSEFSYEKAINLEWIKRIVYGFAGILVLYFIAFALVSAKVMSLVTMDYVILVAYILLFFYIVYFGYSQKEIYKSKKLELDTTEKGQNIKNVKQEDKPHPVAKQVIEIDTNSEIEGLLDLMNREKPFLEPELTIGDLALKINMHAHQLSKLLNNHLNKNFFEFVNEFRVEEFKKLATNPKNKHISVLGLAYDAGFNSKATFYRFFKNTTGLTPSEFMDSYK